MPRGNQKKGNKKRKSGTKQTSPTTAVAPSRTTVDRRFTVEGVQEQKDKFMAEIEAEGKRRIDQLKANVAIIKSALGPELLKTRISLEKEDDLIKVLTDAILDNHKETRKEANTPVVARRRSRSAQRVLPKLPPIPEDARPRRSSSAGGPRCNNMLTPYSVNMHKTPGTVMKAGHCNNPPFKRLMKPGETAVSTCGSPLYVQGRAPVEPEVLIPLENGVIFNIDHENAGANLTLPALNAATKAKLQRICAGIQNVLKDK